MLGAAAARPSLGLRASVGGVAVDEVGEWGAAFDGLARNIAVHAVVLRTGKVLLFFGTPLAAVWDPATGETTEVDAPECVFCAGQAVLPDGRVLVAGGLVADTPESGPPYVFTFDPDTLAWTRHDDMRQGRYYPTVTVLPDGRALITSGKTQDGGHSFNEDLEVFDPATGTLEVVGSMRTGMYPHQFVLPDGRILVAGPERRDSYVIDPTDWSVAPVAPLTCKRVHAGAVLLPGGPEGSWQVLVTGGVARQTTELLDASQASGVWTRGPRLPTEREYMNVVLLPDGTVLGVGGEGVGLDRSAATSWAPFRTFCQLGRRSLEEAAQILAPAQHQTLALGQGATVWAGLASQVENRGYHSTAVLLPDGRVLSAGGTGAGAGQEAIELYSPPYLFRGPRPTALSLPTEATYGELLTIETVDDVARVVLMRPCATTHTNDMDQRHVELWFDHVPEGLLAVAPPTPAVAPPGHYLLFLLSSDGVPSEGRWLHLA
jgi:hypothetical protein